MSSTVSKKSTYKKFETPLDRKANRAFKLHVRELKEKTLLPGDSDIINTDYEDDLEEDDLYDTPGIFRNRKMQR